MAKKQQQSQALEVLSKLDGATLDSLLSFITRATGSSSSNRSTTRTTKATGSSTSLNLKVTKATLYPRP